LGFIARKVDNTEVLETIEESLTNGEHVADYSRHMPLHL
jgi:hypothetical protein